MTIDSRFYDLTAHLWRGSRYSYFWSPNVDGEKYSYWFAVGGDATVPKLFLNTDAYFAVNGSVIRRSEHERARALDGDISVINGFYFEIDFDDEAGKQAALDRIAASPIKPACLNYFDR